jgi:hypothetical protein
MSCHLLVDVPPQVDGSAEGDKADPAVKECRDMPGLEDTQEPELPSQASVAPSHLRKRGTRPSTL